ncbi:efflux RND transporter permease subunit [Pseudoduganella sp. OTU4001]|uniref:efflux RND transporter permease subunit n=1 Tax=Pseudoduganella sp. OTU4001 TaxID=3043854 RepID=UPI00313B5943
MIERIIGWCATHRWSVFAAVLLLAGWAVNSIQKTPLDALPDLSDPQVIVFVEWMGRGPDLVEEQVTYPLVKALQSTPGVRTVRGYSMFGMSFIYVIFKDKTDIYWARTRVGEQIDRARAALPPDVAPQLGPDATGIGWVFQYVIKDDSGQLDLARLRELQDFTIRPALQAVAGVAEVASLGGYERQFQVLMDAEKLLQYGATPSDVSRAVQGANSEVGARVLEMAGREYVLRGRGYVKSLQDLEESVVKLGPGAIPVRLRDVATLQYGPEIRRGAADWNGEGEAVGGIVVMRIGSNALQVNRAIKAQIAALALPSGVRIIPTYDRSELIEGAIDSLVQTLLQQGLIISAVCLVFLFHARSALIAMIILPTSVLLSFIAFRYLGLTANIMSLGGIAIAVGELADAAIVLIENAHVRLAAAGPDADRKRIIIEACQEVGRPIFYSLLLITVSFLPIFALTGQAGRLFDPLAYTKTVAMFAAAVLSITLAPPLMVLLLRGRFRTEEEHPVNRLLSRAFRPIARKVIQWRIAVVSAAAIVVIATIPMFMKLGTEFLPPLNEGSLLVMPTTFPGISIEEARRALIEQDRAIKAFPEVLSVHGKTGRAETATDPAQLDMNEITVVLKPREQWPMRPAKRWHADRRLGVFTPMVEAIWPKQRRFTLDELSSEIASALQMPGYQIAVAPPIRTRIDMLSTGVRTPVGVKVLGDDLVQIERLSLQLEGLLRTVPGTRSTFAERQTGREYIDIIPRRDAIARYGLTVADVHSIVEAAVGGMPVSTMIAGRSRFSANARYAADFRSDPAALKALLVPVAVSGAAFSVLPEQGGRGVSSAAPALAAAGGTAGGMYGMSGAAGAGTVAAANMRQGGMPQGVGNNDPVDAGRVLGPTVPLGELAEIRVVSGPPMIKDEGGVLVGFVFADFDSSKRDIGGWVSDAKRIVAENLTLPPGYRLQWTGQYEFMQEMEERLLVMLPITFVLIVGLLYVSLRGWQQTLLVLLSIPFALAGSVWLLSIMDYNLSTSVWVGMIAVGGVAGQTGIVMIVYLDQAYQRYSQEGRLRQASDIDEAVLDGASSRVRPLVMTVATTVLGLLPLLWEGGVGADLTARTAAPVVGGLLSCMILTLLVLPAAYTLWRRHQWRPENVRIGEGQ